MTDMASESRKWRGELRSAEPMARHVSWRAGGPVARAYFPVDLDDLTEFLGAMRHDESLLFVGMGATLLADAQVECTVA